MAENIDLLRSLNMYSRLYRTKIRRFPRYADLRNMMGLIFYIQGKFRPALRQFDAALSVNPLYEEAMVNRCFTLSQMGRWNGALQELGHFLKKKKRVGHAVHLGLSILCYQKGMFREAVAQARAALKKNPSHPHSLIVTGICCHALGDARCASAMFRKAQEMSYIVAERNKKLEFYDLGKFALEKIERLYPFYIRNPFINDLFVRIGEEMAKSEKNSEARDLIAFAISRGIPSSRMLNFMGIMAMKDKRETDAIRLFYSAFMRDKHNAYPAIHLFFIYGENGQWKKARAILNEALRHNPRYADLHNYKGMFLADMREQSQALKEYRTALQINPKYIDALYNLAQLYENMKRYPEAAETYLKIACIRRYTAELRKKIVAVCRRIPQSKRRMLLKRALNSGQIKDICSMLR